MPVFFAAVTVDFASEVIAVVWLIVPLFTCAKSVPSPRPTQPGQARNLEAFPLWF